MEASKTMVSLVFEPKIIHQKMLNWDRVLSVLLITSERVLIGSCVG